MVATKAIIRTQKPIDMGWEQTPVHNEDRNIGFFNITDYFTKGRTNTFQAPDIHKLKGKTVLSVLSNFIYEQKEGGLAWDKFKRYCQQAALVGTVSDQLAVQIQTLIDKCKRPVDIAQAARMVNNLSLRGGIEFEPKAKGRLYHLFLRHGIRLADLSPKDCAFDKLNQPFEWSQFTELIHSIDATGHLSNKNKRTLLHQLSACCDLSLLFKARRTIEAKFQHGEWSVSLSNKRDIKKFFTNQLQGHLDRELFQSQLKQGIMDEEQVLATLDTVNQADDLAWAHRFVKHRIETPTVRSRFEPYFSERLAGYIDKPAAQHSLDDMHKQGFISTSEYRAINLALEHATCSGDFIGQVMYVFALSRPELAKSLEKLQDAIKEFFRITCLQSNLTLIVFEDGSFVPITELLEAKWHGKMQELAMQQQRLALIDREKLGLDKVGAAYEKGQESLTT